MAVADEYDGFSDGTIEWDGFKKVSVSFEEKGGGEGVRVVGK